MEAIVVTTQVSGTSTECLCKTASIDPNINNHGFFRLKNYFLDDKKQPGFEPRNGWYVTSAKADHAIAQLKEHAETHANKPFFQFLAFTAPHFPLHALPEDIKLFRDRYKTGWNKIQTQRWKRQKNLVR